MLQVGDAEKFPRELGFKRLDASFKVSKLACSLGAKDGSERGITDDRKTGEMRRGIRDDGGRGDDSGTTDDPDRKARDEGQKVLGKTDKRQKMRKGQEQMVIG